MVSTVYQTWGRERNFASCRDGCLPAHPLASALCRLEGLIRSPLYRKLSSAPDTFLLPSRASDLHWTFLSCLSTSAIIYLSPLSCKCSFLLVKGSQMRPQMFFPMSESLSGKREGFQDNATCKREVYCWLEPGLLPHPTQWCRVREPRAQAVTQIYRVNISSW